MKRKGLDVAIKVLLTLVVSMVLVAVAVGLWTQAGGTLEGLVQNQMNLDFGGILG